MSLETRMTLFTYGQATWPIEDAKRRCIDCQKFTPATDKPGEEDGTCDLAREIIRKKPATYNGTRGLECTRFKSKNDDA